MDTTHACSQGTGARILRIENILSAYFDKLLRPEILGWCMAFGSSGDAASKHDDEKEAGHLQQGETVGLDWGKEGTGIFLTKYWYVHA